MRKVWGLKWKSGDLQWKRAFFIFEFLRRLKVHFKESLDNNDPPPAQDNLCPLYFSSKYVYVSLSSFVYNFNKNMQYATAVHSSGKYDRKVWKANECAQVGCTVIENRIYREELKESLGMNFFSPFQPEREFKVYIVQIM